MTPRAHAVVLTAVAFLLFGPIAGPFTVAVVWGAWVLVERCDEIGVE